MTEPDAPGTAKHPVAAHPITSAAIAILMAAAIFFILYSPLYSVTTPKIGALPFFYFYLLVYMPATSLVLWIVTQLQKRLRQPAAPGPDAPAADSEVTR
ncbi:MAG: hypothetical protein ACRDN0_38075 [Trebonia sp.]